MRANTKVSIEELREAIGASDGMRYTYKDILPLVAANAGVSNYVARPVLSASYRMLAELLAQGNSVVLPRVGVFRATMVKSYWAGGLDGGRQAVRKHRRIVFRTSKVLKRRLRGR